MATLPMVAALSDNGALPDPLGLLHGHFDALAGTVEGAHRIGREGEGGLASDIGQPTDIVDACDQPDIGALQAKMHKGFRAHVLDMNNRSGEGTTTEFDPLRADADAAIARRLGACEAKD